MSTETAGTPDECKRPAETGFLAAIADIPVTGGYSALCDEDVDPLGDLGDPCPEPWEGDTDAAQ